MSYEITVKADSKNELEELFERVARGFHFAAVKQADNKDASIASASERAIEKLVAAIDPAEQKQKRTRKNTTAPAPVAPSIAQEPEAPAAIVTESQAQVDNSASETPATPSGANSPEAGADDKTVAVTTESAPSVVTFDVMKAKLQEVAAHFPGDTGLAQVTEILSDFGVRKVKEVKPEDFAAVVAQCLKVLQS